MLVGLGAIATATAQDSGLIAGNNGNLGDLVLNELNGNEKFIELYNKGTESISINGVYIEKDGKNVWKAGDITLEAGAFLLLYSEDVVADHPEYENSGLVFSSGLSAKKEVRVQLFTPAGSSLDDFNLVEYTTPCPASYSRYPDGTGPWVYDDATPGKANAESETLVEGLADPVIDGDDNPGDVTPVDYTGLVLNELNGNDKFIELYNYGTNEISLKGVFIEKDGKNVWKAGDITLAAGGFLLLYSEDVIADHPEYEDSGLIFGSGLSAKKEVQVELFTPAGDSLDNFNLVKFTVPAPASYSRYPDGTGDWMYADATPGYANAMSEEPVKGLEGDDSGDGDTGDDNPGEENPADYTGLVLNELNGNDKFIELYNYGTNEISLKGVFIEKDGKNVWKAGDITLAAGGFLLLYSEDVIADHPEYEDSGLIFGSGLSAKKEVQVELFTPAGDSLDNFNLIEFSIPAPASYSRYPDGTGDWMYADATPGYANAMSDEPVVGLEGGQSGIVDVIETENGNTIYYDLQGRAVLHPSRGIYIINGKKVIIK